MKMHFLSMLALGIGMEFSVALALLVDAIKNPTRRSEHFFCSIVGFIGLIFMIAGLNFVRFL